MNWDTEHPSMDETLIAGCASYQAFSRYLTGTDLFLLPRSRSELESVLLVMQLILFPLPVLTFFSGEDIPTILFTMPSRRRGLLSREVVTAE